MNIIGINGFKRSGKGETARIVSEVLTLDGLEVKSVGFADKLKVLAAKTLGFVDLSDEECIALMDEAKESWVIDILNRSDGIERLSPYSPMPDGEALERISRLTGRQYLQNLGNWARQVFGENFWVDQVLPNLAEASQYEYNTQRTLNERYPGTDVLCITDVRYTNEAQRVKALGGVVWEVLRPGTGSDGHASEQPLPAGLVDWQIHNEDGLDALADFVSEALDETVGL